MAEVLGLGLFVTAYVALFGAPAVLTLTPERWRPWWPALLPLTGLATAAAVLYPLSLVLPLGVAALPGVAIALALTVLAWRRRTRLPRPGRWCLIALLAAAAGGGLAYAPSLRSSEPRAPAILNLDAIYYASVDEWLQDHRLLSAGRPLTDDNFYGPAHEVQAKRLRVGVDLVNATAATLTRTLSPDTLPALIALLTFAAALAAGLLVLAAGAPSAAGAVATLLVALRADGVRLGLDSYVAQVAGVGLAAAALGAVALWLLDPRERRTLVLAGLLCSGLAAFYIEYAPFLGLAGALLVLALLIRPRLGAVADRRDVLVRAALVGAATLAANPIAVVRGIASLTELTKITGLAIVPFYSARENLALLTGPYSVPRGPQGPVEPVAGWIYWLAAACAVAALAGLLTARPRARLLIGSGAVAAATFAFSQRDYSYGAYKTLAIGATVVLAAAALALTELRPRRLRVVVAVALLLLLGVNALGSQRLAKAALDGVNGVQSDDRRLSGLELPGGAAIENINHDHGYSPGAREHWSTYFTRFGAGARVSMGRGEGSYFGLQTRPGAGARDGRFELGYRWVVSLGPSFTHAPAVEHVGRSYVVYRRQGPVDLLTYGPGWMSPQTAADGRPLQFTTGAAELWVVTERDGCVRIAADLLSSAHDSKVRLLRGAEALGQVRLASDRERRWRSPGFSVPRGVTSLVLESEVQEGVGAGVYSLRAAGC